MKKLAYWAKQNPRSARLFIVLGRVTLALSGLVYGLLLTALDQRWMQPLAWSSGGLYLLAFVFYPRRRQLFNGKFLPVSCRNRAYIRRKTCDALLVCSSFVCYIWMGNSLAQPAFPTSQTPPAQVVWSSLERPTTWPKVKNQPQTLKKAGKVLRHALREIRAARKNTDPGTTAGLMALSAILVIVLGILIAAMSCRLACNGQEGAATTLVLLGAVGIGLLLYLIWPTALKADGRKAAGKPDK